MAIIINDPNFDPLKFDPNTYQTSLDTYNGLIKNDPYEPTFSIDPETGKVTSVAGISRYNKVTINSYIFPGTSVVKVKREKKVSIEKGKQGAGNKVVDTGIDLAKVSITTDLYNNSHLDDFKEVLNFFEGKKGLKGSADGFTIVNPVTTVRGVSSVYLESIDGPEFNGGKTTYVTNWVEVVKVKKTKANSIATPKQKDTGLGYLSSSSNVNFNNISSPSKDPSLTQPPGWVMTQTKRKPG